MQDSAEYFINRELSWCEFNHRVLEEAMDETVPLLERFRFASIVASNLDEFFMVRVAGLKRRIDAEDRKKGPAGLRPVKVLASVSERIHRMVSQLYSTILNTLLPQVRAQGISLQARDTLTPKQITFVEKLFDTEIFPVLTPVAVDPTHPFPVLQNLSLNIGVALAPKRDGKNRLAIVPIPTVIPRLLTLPSPPGEYAFILLEEVVRHFLFRLFTGQEILESAVFRITRDAELEFDDEGSSDLLQVMEGELRKRRTNPSVRLEILKGIGEGMMDDFRNRLGLGKNDIYVNPSFLDPRFLMSFADLPGYDSLLNQPLPPQMPAAFEQQRRIWPLLRERDLLLHHPYESFEPVTQLVSQAADDPDVLAIKQTLYRTSGDSLILQALSRAARNGKQVTVLVELMARFDEERNIGWARELENSGVHVIYGLVGLKTHSKILLVVRRDRDGIRRYVHLGTGNYNDRTARLYTDVGLLTCDHDIGLDASGFFNTITGYSDPPEFRKLTMAPLGLRERFLHLIVRETERAKSGQAAAISAKMNSLVDPQLIRALCEASQAGVQIRLIVRGICCLRPGIKGLSDNVSVMSIVDRFLEHSRIFYFLNGGEEEYYCSSADWMPRNLDRRVELLFPVTSEEGKKSLQNILDQGWADNVKARVLQSDGSYSFRKRRRNEEPLRSQQALYDQVIRQQERSRTIIFRPQARPS